ncbi:pantoate--beta-alanine ligase [Marinobacterium jannaschii]|uniref:pantoate--beta-alanine ligase n=1 Tax=Marinobacterium jannaschii TaxID=64970 RepID=UPI00047F38E1|nr:pantoate--beta-alanine ligase [Marinobacterium jannaschii]
MKTIHSITELRQQLDAERAAGKRVALVPTMGNLHEGHLRLVDQARDNADIVVTSIFVNPLQFGENEDLDAYPRTLANDEAKLASRGCHYVFAPSDTEMYPQGREGQCQVYVPTISAMHCGASRPGHFQGVTTVVCKLFGIVQPDVAIFGEKDFQQLLVIRKMAEDLYLPVEIQGAPIARDDRQLALSSRNGYLTAEELEIAPALNRALREARSAILQGRRDYDQLAEDAQQSLEQAGFSRDYFNIVRRNDLQKATAADAEIVILAAAYLGKARLIDNQEIDIPAA